MRLEEALRAAESMMDLLRPACEGFEPGGSLGSISIAGSLRRRVDKNFDEIDLIMIPDLSPPPLPRAEFGKPIPKIYKTKIDKLLAELVDRGDLIQKTAGDRAKRFFWEVKKIKLDLYLVRPPATWGVQYAIRTGPEDFGHWLVTRRSGSAHSSIHGRVRGGALRDGYRVQGGAVWEGEEKIPDKELLEKTPIGFETEEDFFSFLGLNWIEPEDRVARWGSK